LLLAARVTQRKLRGVGRNTVMRKAITVIALLGLAYGLSACSVWHHIFG
jgi:hypothetical protein